MTRRGKIARLPRVLRDELNQRIEDGETGARLVEWLNGRDDVQGVLKIHFSGRAINEQNVSDWRAGGYADWQEQQATFELANGIMDEGAAVAEAMARPAEPGASTGGRSLADHVGDMAALSLAKMLRAMRRMEDGPEQWETTLKIVREVVRLRHSDRTYEEAQRRRETHEHTVVQDWQRARAATERAEEKVDQLIMRKLVAAGRGKLEDIPAPTWSTHLRQAYGGQDGGQAAARREPPAPGPMAGEAEGRDEMDLEGEAAARDSASDSRGRGAEAGGDRPEHRATAGGETQPLESEPTQAGKPGAPTEAGKAAQAAKPAQAGEPEAGQAPQAPAVPQGSSGSIKVNQRSRREERWIGPWRVG